MSEKNITFGKKATGRSSLYEKSKKEYKDKKMCGENAWEKVIEKRKQSSWRCSVKKVFLEILQNSQENTCARVLF